MFRRICLLRYILAYVQERNDKAPLSSQLYNFLGIPQLLFQICKHFGCLNVEAVSIKLGFHRPYFATSISKQYFIKVDLPCTYFRNTSPRFFFFKCRQKFPPVTRLLIYSKTLADQNLKGTEKIQIYAKPYKSLNCAVGEMD